jgi:AbrB family transcriptional regulator (stage V sporulation protein T)
MSQKSTYVLKNGAQNILVSDGNSSFRAGIAAPIIYDGDAIGTVMFLSSPEKEDFGEVEQKLAESAASFLGKTIE